jgi:hypothetical protein
MSNANNVALTTADPFDFDNRGDRTTADELGANGYCRPQDNPRGELANGNQLQLWKNMTQTD